MTFYDEDSEMFYDDDWNTDDFDDDEVADDVVFEHSEIAILNGNVWSVYVIVFDNGVIDVSYVQQIDTCWDGKLPF